MVSKRLPYKLESRKEDPGFTAKHVNGEHSVRDGMGYINCLRTRLRQTLR